MVRFFISIDGILFNFISTLYDLLIAISRTSILTQGDIAQFAARIEILLGIFMLFKLSFSLITYIVNPDDFSDKSKGFGKLIQNSVISLVLLVTTPYIFQMAFNLQAKILDDNTLAKLLLGEKLADEENESNNVTILDTAGDRMAFYVMLPFFTPRTSINGLDVCVNIYENGSFNDDCYNALLSVANTGDNSSGNVVEDFSNTITGNDSNEDSAVEQYITNYKYGIENESVGLTFRANTALITAKDGDDELFVIDYKYLLSTATAVIICLLLITFCIDIGLRSVKLAFLQLIYPIPVISYMDPGSGKDGMFSKWYKMCLSTFLSLFIRLLALYFGIYIITKVGSMGMYDIINGSQITNGWVKIFVIVGILMFVKQMPKILENLGIKIDGDGKFNLNPLKKLEEGALGGKAFGAANKVAKGAAIGLGGAALVGGASALTGKGLHGTARAMRDAITGGFKGNKFGKNFTSSYGAGAARKREIARMKNDGVSPASVGWENFKNKFAGMTEKDKYDDFTSSVKAVQDNFKTFKSSATGVDKVAKELDRLKQMADAKGDAVNSKKYDDALKQRLNEIQTNAMNGKKSVVTGKYNVDLSTITADEDGKFNFGINSDSLSHDKGIESTLNNTVKVINHINSTYDGQYNYEKGDIGDFAGEGFKTVSGKANSVLTAAAQSDEVRKMEDKYKYVTNDSKK